MRDIDVSRIQVYRVKYKALGVSPGAFSFRENPMTSWRRPPNVKLVEEWLWDRDTQRHIMHLVTVYA